MGSKTRYARTRVDAAAAQLMKAAVRLADLLNAMDFK
jgi:hypothetical protein